MKMKCCGCEKEIDLTKHEVIDNHAQWYGKHNGQTCLKVICYDCITDPEKKEAYSNG